MTCHFLSPGPLHHTPPWEPGQAFLTQDTWPPWGGAPQAARPRGNQSSATFDLSKRLPKGLWQKRSTIWASWLHGVVRGVSLAIGQSPPDPLQLSLGFWAQGAAPLGAGTGSLFLSHQRPTRTANAEKLNQNSFNFPILVAKIQVSWSMAAVTSPQNRFARPRNKA